ncbi:NAD(+) diphosphatase [Knoellia subterranea]|uniref:NAD(+) diphosphatase n=1 Tax=Knoellia subterranea KCTC 19937 TaxID=1385521 RepID=A0A0A0JPK6_9MICO|nr:NAD(+) diphosphatase [Knoellia subterranea]KGN39390.1 NUDIX hydrolase [Knoellia subterranea KCTC 19937]
MARAASLPSLALSRGGLDRHSELRTEPGLLDVLLDDPATRVLELAGGRAEVVEDPQGELGLRFRAPTAADRGGFAAYLGHDAPAGGTAYVLIVSEGTPAVADDPRWKGLRSVGAQLPDLDAGVLTTATGLANWHARHGFCSVCGSPTEPAHSGWIRVCPRDESEHYPRTDPAVIMSVVDDHDRLLLARGVGFAPQGMSVLAGFVEPGESLAGAVAREVHEEVGVTVDDVTYLGDQPWPFPSSLMVGFTARATSTELTLQESEIEEARWFERDELRRAVEDGSLRISQRISIARRLIEHWYGEEIDVPDRPLRG